MWHVYLFVCIFIYLFIYFIYFFIYVFIYLYIYLISYCIFVIYLHWLGFLEMYSFLALSRLQNYHREQI